MVTSHQHPGEILIRPRVTEKATRAAEKNTYVFDVAPGATKHEVKRAVAAAYGVSIRAVRMVRAPGKRIMVRGRPGKRPGVTKAYVSVSPGEKLDIF